MMSGEQSRRHEHANEQPIKEGKPMAPGRLGARRGVRDASKQATYTEREDSGGSSDEEGKQEKEVGREPQPRRGDQVPPNRRVQERGASAGWAWEVIDPKEMMGWEAPPIGKGALSQMRGTVTLVWRVTSEHRMPWVIVAESALLRKVGTGLRKGKVEMGLYAWRDFEDDEIIGIYTGTESSPFASMNEGARERAKAQVTTEEGEDMIIEVEIDGKKSKFVNGERGTAPFVQRANDGKGKNTARVTPVGGVMRSMGKQKWVKVTPKGGWEQMEKREITWSYGRAYWKEREGSEKGAPLDTAERNTAEKNDAQEEEDVGGTAIDGTEEYLSGTLWYDLGKSAALCNDTEERKRVEVMYITEGWVHDKERRKGWMAKAMEREVRAATRIEEVHLIAQNAEAAEAWRGMGFTEASEAQVSGEWTAYQPGEGETYMAATRRAILDKLGQREGRRQAASQGRMIKLEKCRQARGAWYEKAAVQAVKEWHTGEEGWDISRTIPGGADGRGRNSIAVFMIQQGPGHPDERPPSRGRARPTSASGSRAATPANGRAATPANGRDSRTGEATPKRRRSKTPTPGDRQKDWHAGHGKDCTCDAEQRWTMRTRRQRPGEARERRRKEYEEYEKSEERERAAQGQSTTDIRATGTNKEKADEEATEAPDEGPEVEREEEEQGSGAEDGHTETAGAAPEQEAQRTGLASHHMPRIARPA